MNPHVVGCLVATVLVLAPHVQETAPLYKFTKGDLAKYDVTGELRISLKGSHKVFMEGGFEEPIRLSYRARFENKVVEVFENGSARLERRVRTLSAEGMISGNPFKFAWDRDKDQGKAARPEEGPGTVAGLFRTWCTEPLPFGVSAEGKYECAVANYDQLANKAGVMYWVLGRDSKPWITEEKIAAPLLHNKVVIEFKCEFVKTSTVGGRKLLVIHAKPGLKGTIEPPPEAPRLIDGPIEFTVSGDRNQVEFDATNRRLHSVKLDLTINLSGTGTVAGEGKGDLRGELKFIESQHYRE